MVVEFSVIPIGGGASMSGRLAKVMRLIDSSGLNYRMGAMGTSVEGGWDEILRLVKRCHRLLLAGSPRVLTHIVIDDRKGGRGRLVGKVASVARKSGRSLKT